MSSVFSRVTGSISFPDNRPGCKVQTFCARLVVLAEKKFHRLLRRVDTVKRQEQPTGHQNENDKDQATATDPRGTAAIAACSAPEPAAASHESPESLLTLSDEFVHVGNILVVSARPRTSITPTLPPAVFAISGESSAPGTT